MKNKVLRTNTHRCQGESGKILFRLGEICLVASGGSAYEVFLLEACWVKVRLSDNVLDIPISNYGPRDKKQFEWHDVRTVWWAAQYESMDNCSKWAAMGSDWLKPPKAALNSLVRPAELPLGSLVVVLSSPLHYSCLTPIYPLPRHADMQ